MEIGEFTYTPPHAHLFSVLFCFIAIMMVGGAVSAPPNLSRVNYSSKEPLQGAKMTGMDMDILEFRDNNRPAHKEEIWTN